MVVHMAVRWRRVTLLVSAVGGVLGLGSLVALVAVRWVGGGLSSAGMAAAIAAVLLLGGASMGFSAAVLVSLRDLTGRVRALPTLIDRQGTDTARAIAEISARGEETERRLQGLGRGLKQLARPGPNSPLKAAAFAVEADKRMLELVEAIRQMSVESSMATDSAVAARLKPLGDSLTEFERVVKASSQRIMEAVDQAYRQIEGLFVVYRNLAPDHPLPAFRGWAVSPDLAAHLVRVVHETRPGLVVEVGSGLSTLLVGLTLRRLGGGRVLGLEHDPAYAEATAKLLARFDVAAFAEVVHAPLMNYDIEGTTWRWYDLAGIEVERPIDLLVVNGPPRSTGPLARYPAVPLLAPHLAPGAVVILDDTHRPDESEIAARWASRFSDLTLEFLDFEKGAAQLRRSGAHIGVAD
jgi:predicted O-methyltransferase YrrM